MPGQGHDQGEQCTLGRTELKCTPTGWYLNGNQQVESTVTTESTTIAMKQPSPTLSPTPVLRAHGWGVLTSRPRFQHRLNPTHRGTGPEERAALGGAFHLDLVSLTPVHIINQVPLFSELKVVDQDGNTVGSHEVIWISRKTLVLPGFGVTYERKEAPVIQLPQCSATTANRQTDRHLDTIPSLSLPHCTCTQTLSAR